jgi:hypothetical protein
LFCAPAQTSRILEPGIPPGDQQHPTASSPFVRSTQEGEVPVAGERSG